VGLEGPAAVFVKTHDLHIRILNLGRQTHNHVGVLSLSSKRSHYAPVGGTPLPSAQFVMDLGEGDDVDC
jgi:hypothetical protein